MLRIAATIAAFAVGATVVYAQNTDVIKQRRDSMRSVAKAAGASFKIVKGDVPFDLATVQATLKTIQEQAPKFKELFPDDSKTGGNTGAQPTIWTSKADFNAIIDKWIADAKAGSAAITDEASFKATYPKIADTCGGCHKATDGYSIALGDAFKKMRDPL